MSQTQLLRVHLDKGLTITPMEALSKWGCMRLAARVLDLKACGYPVSKVNHVNSRGKRYAIYWKTRT